MYAAEISGARSLVRVGIIVSVSQPKSVGLQSPVMRVGVIVSVSSNDETP